ncbi:MAG: sodium:proton antiporter [Planctomycetota bacterium]|nr:MAG: sodium:proton antiporter [Planctomycetota bacterium]
MYELLALLAAFALLYSVFAGVVERSWISGPIVFTAFGLAVGPYGFDLVSTLSDPELLKGLAELTLALVLFTDASSSDLNVLGRTRALPLRLLALGLPLTILLGYGAGLALFDGLTLFELALIATMLAPTDAALGQAVVTNPAVPGEVREALNVESGLNDGICVPIMFLFLGLASGTSGESSPLSTGLSLFAADVGIGLAVGLALAAAGAWMIRLSRGRGWLSPIWSKVTVIALAFTAFGGAQSLGGSGFIAAFAGGLLFGGLARPHRDELLGAAEGIGDTFSLLTWTLFGAVMVGPALTGFDGATVLYALLSLTLVRILPVVLVVSGMGLSLESRLFMGWFGPRGLASIVFAVIVAGSGLPHGSTITSVVVCTVLLSVVLHGVTASPWATGFGRRAQARSGGGR